jgi:hypothetical protein
MLRTALWCHELCHAADPLQLHPPHRSVPRIFNPLHIIRHVNMLDNTHSAALAPSSNTTRTGSCMAGKQGLSGCQPYTRVAPYRAFRVSQLGI